MSGATAHSSADSSRATQRGRILQLLIAARGAWVPLPEIAACAAQYNARIFELRRLGFRIESQVRKVDGARHSWFRLARNPAYPADSRVGPRTENSLPRELDETLPLFPGDKL
jgi:hypothetical protein